MVIDFRELKEMVSSVISSLDHIHLNDVMFFKKENPSSENIAKYIYVEMEKRLNNVMYKDVYMHRVKVYETETSYCIYGE
jgi:6-pyruvoyltetrahydropterin/6-carboxytetrahydropterin synthase